MEECTSISILGASKDTSSSTLSQANFIYSYDLILEPTRDGDP